MKESYQIAEMKKKMRKYQFVDAEMNFLAEKSYQIAEIKLSIFYKLSAKNHCIKIPKNTYTFRDLRIIWDLRI